MNDTTQDIQRLSADKLLNVFTRTPLLSWLLLAAAIHLVLIGVTSVGYIKQTWLGIEPPKPPPAAVTTANDGEAESEAPAEDGTAEPAASPPDTGESKEPRQPSPVEEETSSLPEEGEVPAAPGLELDLD